MSKTICTNIKNHTPQPTGYVGWHQWAEEMSETHEQVTCPRCGFHEIWIPVMQERIAFSTSHFKDPCIECGTPHNDVEIGDCPGRRKARSE